jgi:hypothetical protein
VPFEITQIVWLEDIVEKLRWKHPVEEAKVVEVLQGRPASPGRKQATCPVKTYSPHLEKPVRGAS